MKKLIIILVLLSSIQSVNAFEIMPDDPLYFLDRAVEKIQLSLALTSSKNAQLNIQFDQERIQEAEVMIAENKVEEFKEVVQLHKIHLATLETNMETIAADDITIIKGQLEDIEQQVIDLSDSINGAQLSIEDNAALDRGISDMSTRVSQASTEAQAEIEEQEKLATGWVTDEKIDELLENINSWDRALTLINANEGQTATVRIQDDGADTQVFNFKVLEGRLIRCDCASDTIIIIDKENILDVTSDIDSHNWLSLSTRAVDIGLVLQEG